MRVPGELSRIRARNAGRPIRPADTPFTRVIRVTRADAGQFRRPARHDLHDLERGSAGILGEIHPHPRAVVGVELAQVAIRLEVQVL